MSREPPRERVDRIGVISDTHGYLDARVIDAFVGTELIIHAGDIGKPKILAALATVAPVRAVRGNTDHGPWADDLPTTALVTLNGVTLYVLHDIQQLDLEPQAAGIRVVISGHTHRASLEEKNNVVFLNPGSAVEPRHNSPPTVAILTARGENLDARFIELVESKNTMLRLT
jgi:putative phosphoesterase